MTLQGKQSDNSNFSCNEIPFWKVSLPLLFQILVFLQYCWYPNYKSTKCYLHHCIWTASNLSNSVKWLKTRSTVLKYCEMRHNQISPRNFMWRRNDMISDSKIGKQSTKVNILETRPINKLFAFDLTYI